MVVQVLRLGHRIARDRRITTHVALVARAFGATSMIFCGQEDKTVIKSLEAVVRDWGGSFETKYAGKDWKRVIKEWKHSNTGKIVHLTMYGEQLQKVIEKLRRIADEESLLIVVGSEKVPRSLYQIADYNVAITNQPHSEIAALGVFLNNLFRGTELEKQYLQAKLQIIPSLHDKKVVKIEGNERKSEKGE